MFEQDVNLGPGTGTFTQHTFEILIMLLGAFLLGIWLGWMLWNRYKQEADKLRLDNQSLSASFNALNTELTGVKAKLATSEANNISLRNQVDKLTEDNRIYREQLTDTSEDLAETEQRNRVLETELGLSASATPATPETIPLQVDLAPEMQFDAPPVIHPADVLAEHDNEPTVVIVVEPPVTETAPPVAEEPAPVVPEENPEENATATTVSAPEAIAPEPEAPVVIVPPPLSEKDDLTVIEGIGPKIQELLYQYDIRTYRQLADAEVTRLKEILAAAGPQLAMHDPGTWPSQANLAANDQWEQLKSIQGFLKGGRTPNGEKRG